MIRKKMYKNYHEKNYEELKIYFAEEINFSTKEDLDNVLDKIDDSKIYTGRVWTLLGKDKSGEWIFLQVAQTKSQIKEEIETDIAYLYDSIYKDSISKYDMKYKSSSFYENVFPYFETQENEEVVDRKRLMYSKIGTEYDEFRLCLLDVDKYLQIEEPKNEELSDTEKIVQICKNQYAEAKLAFSTMAIYWRLYSSGVDGQTVMYFLEMKESL